MRLWMIGVAALTSAAAPANAQVTLTPGHSVTFTFDSTQQARPGPVRAAKPGAHDLDALDQLRGLYDTNPPEPGEIAAPVPLKPGVPLPAIAPDQASFMFFVTDRDSMLAVQNGYGRGVMYRATITVRGRSEPTDVCMLLPGKRGNEHWPYVIDKIELSELTLEDWSPGDPLPCR